ncbi:MAG: hypothetical protein WD877_02255 [Candidatus Saccharimonadales bacterium]
MSKPFAIVFAGVPGSSKSIIAYYLSGKFGIPIFSNDGLRYEVKEDLLINNLILKEDLLAEGINAPKALAEYEKRLSQRREELLGTGRPIIFDGSIDRRWAEAREQLLKHQYSWFMISINLSREFLENLFSATNRAAFIPKLDKYFGQHERFLEKYGHEVSIEINDKSFKDRLKVSAEALQNFIDK